MAPSSSSSSLSSCEIATFYDKESQMSPPLTFAINLSLCALFLIPSTFLSLPSRQIISTSPACDSPIQWVFDKQIFSSFPCDCFCQVFAQSSSCPPSQNKSQKFSQRPLWRIFIKPHSTMPTCNWDTASIVSDETVRGRFELSPHPQVCITSLEQCEEFSIQCIHGSQHISLRFTSNWIHSPACCLDIAAFKCGKCLKIGLNIDSSFKIEIVDTDICLFENDQLELCFLFSRSLGLPAVEDVQPKQPNCKNGKHKHIRNNDQLVVSPLMRDSAIE